MRELLLKYYEQERNFLRRAGADFARRYEKVADRLLLEPDKCDDPHVERLIQAVAFMAGRIQLKLEDEFPELTESLLNVLYPHYLAPIPSMTVARFALDPQQGKLTSGYVVPRGTTLFTAPVDNAPCRFRTCYPVTIWPIEVESARLEPRGAENTRGQYGEAVLRLTLRCLNNTTLSALARAEASRAAQREHEAGPLESLRFYLRAEAELAHPLYEMIFNNATGVELRGAGAEGSAERRGSSESRGQATLGAEAIRPVGFGADESLFPRTPHTARTFAGYRLLTEYFAFPKKFLFFDVAGVGAAARGAHFGGRFEILIHLHDVTPPPFAVDGRLFQMACTPVVNLFEKLAEPLDLTHRQHEYRVIADVNRQAGTEVYSVDEVTAYGSMGQDVRRFHPFYSYRHADNPDGEEVFWYATRRPVQTPSDDVERDDDGKELDRKDLGTEVYLSLVDLQHRRRTPPVGTLNVWVTCSNRDLPGKLPFVGRQSDFNVERPGPLGRAECLHKMTETVRPPLRRAAHWRLISHLSLNYLSIVAADDDGSPHALREILLLYSHLNSTATRKQIEGLSRIGSRRVTRRVGRRIDEGYVRGVETTIEFDEEHFVGSGLYLFASVLERFLGLYASVNSFTQLVATVKHREGVLKRWAPRAGEQQML